MYQQRIALMVASVVTLLPGTSPGLFGPRNIFGNFFVPLEVELLEQSGNQTLIPSPTSAGTPAAVPAVENRFGIDDFPPRMEEMQEFGDQCPNDLINDYKNNEDICRRCSEHYGNWQLGNLCRQNCFTSCYYVRCKNLLECHWPYPTD